MQRHHEGVVRVVKLLVTGVACMALVAACAAGGKRMATSPTEAAPAGAGQTAMPGDPHAEIERLYADIEQRRGELGMTEPQAANLPSGTTPMATVPLSTDATCKPAKTDRCTQSCTLSDSICGNAKKICDLAEQLTADTWAADKCSRAKATCDTAHENCCTCQ